MLVSVSLLEIIGKSRQITRETFNFEKNYYSRREIRLKATQVSAVLPNYAEKAGGSVSLSVEIHFPCNL